MITCSVQASKENLGSPANTAVSTRHFDIIRSVKIIYGNHILLGQGFEKDVLPGTVKLSDDTVLAAHRGCFILVASCGVPSKRQRTFFKELMAYKNHRYI